MSLAGAVAAVLLAAAAPAALAHAAYKSSNPADGSTVASPPGSITAEFTEPLTDSSSMQVFDPCGAQVDHGDSQPNGYNMTVSMSGDKAGTYTVEFKAQSALDSHVTSGSFTFTSSGGAACPGAEPPPDPGSGGGGSGGGGNGEGRSGGGSTGGGAPQGSSGSATSGGTDDPAVDAPNGGAGRSNGNARTGGPARGPRTGGGSGESTDGPVAFQNTGSTQPTGEPAPWDLPLGGVVLAFALCVMIGAAGGRVYAGIVAPRR
jgi:methionine-rich copper-binding protein CopC